MSDEISRVELIQLLTQLAVRDLDVGFSIYDHPCSVAIRQIQELAAENKALRKDTHYVGTTQELQRWFKDDTK